MSLILGLNAFHPDSAACVLVDGKLVAAVAEERLGARHKHVAGFPALAINRVLKMAGASIRDVEHVAIGNDSNANLGVKVRHVLGTPFQSARGVLTHFQRRAKMRGFPELIAEACGGNAGDCRFRVHRVEHHLAHLASSYYASDFDEAAGFSYDGAGDFTSAMFARCRDNRIEILDRVHVPHSLGFFYTALCQFIGFDKFGEEYKVMGLSAYGQPVYLDLMRELICVEPANGDAPHPTSAPPRPFRRGEGRGEGTQFRLHPDYFRPLGKNLEECVDETGEIVLPPLYTEALVRRLGAPRKRGAEFTQRDKDIAASVQLRFEEVVLECLAALHQRVPVSRLVTAGGCALNGVCNARILRDTPFTRSYIQCAASDDGTAIGAALHVWNAVLGRPRAGKIEHGYWGPEYPEADCEAALRQAGLAFERFERDGLLRRTAAHLNAGHVTGWYQGRSEWGPRALGNRSILAHPGWPGMKELINAKIKRREAFRPFAPSILAEAVPDYFEQTVESPFMMHVVKIRPEKRAALSAVCHEDGTGRLQTVSRAQNPLYYDLIQTFAVKSGTPVVLNTSFNENEPVVDTPAQALACFLRTDMDALVLGPFITHKPGKAVSP
ncbi:MAG: carbamoyltransferase [Limisphaerales bacterium]